jgi:hypothetical protein
MTSPADWTWLTPEIEAVQAHHRASVEELYSSRRGCVAISGPMFGRSHGLSGDNTIDMLEQPDAWLADVVADMQRHTKELADRDTFCPLLIELDPLGTHFIDALLGANVFFKEGQVWSEPLDCGVSELKLPELDRSPVLQKTLRLARRAVEVSDGRLLISTPVLSCPLNIGMNLFGQRIFEALIEEPGSAQRALRIITDVIIACGRLMREIVPQEALRMTVGCNRYAPAGFGFIDGCATQLVSGRHYREHVAPLDSEILSVWPHGGMIHLCGASAQHIETWRAMQPLASVQLNDRAADDLPRYAASLRPDQVLYVSPTATVKPADLLRLAETRPVVLQCPKPRA